MLMDAPKVEFAERVATASGVLIGNYAKVLGTGPKLSLHLGCVITEF